MQPRGVWVGVIVVGILMFFAVFFWSSVPTKYDTDSGKWSFGLPVVSTERQVNGSALSLASSPNYVMDEGWYNSLLWLKDSSNSPEPFGDPDFYYELYPPRDEFEYPASAYGVMSWWDYGHFIMQIAHRIPNANPGQAGAVKAGEFFTALNESSADKVADEEGTKYVMIDYMMTISKFYAMVQWANKSEDELYGLYLVPFQGGSQWVALYYPAYYQSMVARLYNFDAKNVTPTQPLVVSYGEKDAVGGQKYREVISAQSFATYEEAQVLCLASSKLGLYALPVFPAIALATAKLLPETSYTGPLEEPSYYQLTRHLLSLTLIAAGLLLMSRLILGVIPSTADCRTLWHELRPYIPTEAYEIVAVDERIDGLWFYDAMELENVTRRNRPYPTFVAPETIQNELADMHEDVFRHLFVIQGQKHLLEIKAALQAPGWTIEQVQLRYDRWLLVCTPQPTDKQ